MCVGAFVSLFGRIPRLAVLEAFAENPDDSLSAPEIEDITGVSRRAAYLIIRHYLSVGVLVRDATAEGRADKYQLNSNDVRGRSLELLDRLITLGTLESVMKRESGISQSEPLPGGLLSPPAERSFPESLGLPITVPVATFLSHQAAAPTPRIVRTPPPEGLWFEEKNTAVNLQQNVAEKALLESAQTGPSAPSAAA